jgi:C-terminal processing protease CtpA/Prc
LQFRSARSLRFDSVNHIAFIDLNTFSRGSQIKKFLRSSFKSFQKNKIEYLVIDVRGNGGGTVTNSTAITRYLAKEPFKVADSLYAIKRKSKYGNYIENDFFNRLFMGLFAKRKKDGYYHFGYFERHYFKPKKKNHFDGKVYIITGGNSFSATTLFVTSLMKQENVIVVGEETGGGAYGNSAWLIPEVTLPRTKVRFRLPLFRLVIDKDLPKDGRGVMPEIEAKPTSEAIRKGRDYKMDKVMELIRQDKMRFRN